MQERQNIRRLAALGEIPAELVLKNARIVNLFSGRIIDADVAVQDGVIVGVGSYRGGKEIDLRGRYLTPGLIDAHLHIESSMVSPKLFLERVLPWGTTALIADPHEIVNVLGAEGMHYLLRETENVPADVYAMLPSCVPANKLEQNGCPFTAADMEEFANHPRVLGLGEVMDASAVLSGDGEMEKKLRLCRDKVIDGHAPGLSSRELQAYRLSGVLTDHECVGWEEALCKLEQGFYIQIREGSAARNLEAIVTGMLKDKVPGDRFLFCTDDKHLDDIKKEGHIRWNVKKAVSLGLDPITALRMATLNPARAYGLRDTGAVAPGYKADLVVWDNLTDFNPLAVYKDGKLISENGSPVEIAPRGVPIPDGTARRTVKLPSLQEKDFVLKAERDFPVVEVIPHEIVTRKRVMTLPSDGEGNFKPGGDLLKIAVIERHGKKNRMAVGVISGIGLKGGAIAATVAHDSHNLLVVGDSNADMLAAVKALEACQGGYAIAAGGKALMLQPLPVAGLFTDDPDSGIEENVAEMLRLARKMGVREGIDPFTTLSFMALPVIPELRVTDAGVYDVSEGKILIPARKIGE